MNGQEKANLVTYVFSGITVAVSKLNFNEWMMLAGMLIALAGYVTSAFFQWRRDRREAKIAEFSIKQAKSNIRVNQSQG